MRLICPRCGAHYEVETAAIPASGREVECSACDHVWRARPSAPGFDPAERPTLSRELSESVVGILREEAARELQARAAEQSGRAPQAAPPAQSAGPDAGPGDIARAAARDRGPDGVVLPEYTPGPVSGDGDDFAELPDDANVRLRAAAQDTASPTPSGDGDDTAAPITPSAPSGSAAQIAPAASVVPVTPVAPVAAQTGREPRPPAQAEPTNAAATPVEPPPARRVPPRSTARPADMPVAPRETLAPATSRQMPPVPAPADPTPIDQIPPQPTPVAQRKPRSGYAAGFRLAMIVALAAVALYALAPRLADQGALGQRLTEWRAGVDQGRDWLAARADALMARGAD